MVRILGALQAFTIVHPVIFTSSIKGKRLEVELNFLPSYTNYHQLLLLVISPCSFKSSLWSSYCVPANHGERSLSWGGWDAIAMGDKRTQSWVELMSRWQEDCQEFPECHVEKSSRGYQIAKHAKPFPRLKGQKANVPAIRTPQFHQDQWAQILKALEISTGGTITRNFGFLFSGECALPAASFLFSPIFSSHFQAPLNPTRLFPWVYTTNCCC